MNTIKNGLLKLEKILEDCDQSHSKVVVGYYKRLQELVRQEGILENSEEYSMLEIHKQALMKKCNLEWWKRKGL